MFSDPKYSFLVCQTYFFAVSKKVNIFHHSQPNYADYALKIYAYQPYCGLTPV